MFHRLGEGNSQKFVQTLEQLFKLPRGTFSNLRKENFQITFKVNPNYRELNASSVASQIGTFIIENKIELFCFVYYNFCCVYVCFAEDYANVIKNITGYSIKETGIGDKVLVLIEQVHSNGQAVMGFSFFSKHRFTSPSSLRRSSSRTKTTG